MGSWAGAKAAYRLLERPEVMLEVGTNAIRTRYEALSPLLDERA
jgi:hypothetical protein